MFAAMFDRLEAVDLLLRRGASPDRRDAGGATAAALACAMGARRTAARLEGQPRASGQH
jgi:ankyrin repeat protein